MDQLMSFLRLGGYGGYVWPAYGVALAVMGGLLWRTLGTLRANERLVAGLQPPRTPVAASREAVTAADGSRS